MADVQQLVGSLLVGKNQNQPSFRVSVAEVDPNTGDPVSIDPGVPLAPVNGSPPAIYFAKADALASAGVVGLAASAGEFPGQVDVQYAGPLTLTTEQWDARTGGSGGLMPNKAYYLSEAVAGRITITVPGNPDFATPIGYSISPTTLMIQLGVPVPVSP